MPATKRKRSSGRRSYRRSYKRSRGVNSGDVVRALAKANASMGPFGPGSANFEKYGPSKRQMLANPGLAITAAQKQQRMLDRYYGDGDYWSDLGQNIYKNVITPVGHWGARGLGGIAGGMAGAEGGIPGILGGAALGWNSGAEFSKAMGWGDYAIRGGKNQIIAGGTPPPLAVNGDLSGDIVLSHREFIGNVVSTCPTGTKTSPFEIREYALNPGLNTFPFLSQIAKQFEMYEFRGLMFQFVSTYGESVSGANNLGKVIMATNYDPDATEFKSSMQMQNYAYSQCMKPSEHAVHGVETHSDKRATDLLYVRSDALESKDKIFTDIGRFALATEGIPHQSEDSTAIVGELWVSYSIRLSRPKLPEYGEHQHEDTIWLNSNSDSSVGHNSYCEMFTSSNVGGAKFLGHSVGRSKLEYVSATAVRVVFQAVRKGQVIKFHARWTANGTFGKASGDSAMCRMAYDYVTSGTLELLYQGNGSATSTMSSVDGALILVGTSTTPDPGVSCAMTTYFFRSKVDGDASFDLSLISQIYTGTSNSTNTIAWPSGALYMDIDYSPSESVAETKNGGFYTVHDQHLPSAVAMNTVTWEGAGYAKALS